MTTTDERSRPARVLLGVPAALFVVTLVCGAFLLPARVDVYVAPGAAPDVTYELWEYLTLVVVGTALLAFVMGMLCTGFLSVARTFGGRPAEQQSLMVPVAAWILLCSSAAIWLTIWLGNGQPVRRSWLELALDLIALTGAALITAAQVRRGLRGVAEPRSREAP